MRPGGELGFEPSDEEKFICQFERKLEIQNIQFEVFERSIKRFGYCIALTDDCWRATVAETKVDVEKFKEHGNVQHSYFQHKQICDHGRYNAKKVLYISFLHSKHRARISQERALWGIINPQLNDYITHEEAQNFFDDLALIAIELPLKHCRSTLKKEVQKAKTNKEYVLDPDYQAQLESVIAYLEKSSELRDA